ncbi:restriction endonuclease subunit S [Acinetobacter towneri]|uniref:restriction endonuclease subunit S n=1 Tax=Acinetobacter towneri TaxID=202956 RepID=UPI002574FD23|nr:restriction endonuclease subunit S [Acinetobacter towneri]MDM1755805.1 restriction endonuclease subunit S [Acinetobacter towneri]
MSDWITAKLKEVAKVVTGKTPQTSNSEYYGGDIPFVSPADLNEGILSETKTYLTSSGADQVYRVPKNTVLVSCIGNLGKLAITSKEVCFNQQINGLIFDEQKIFPKYGFYFAQTLKPQLEKASSSTTLPIINKSRFSDLEIKYPPLAEQRRIASILDQADELRQKRQQAIEKLDQLLQATFIDMFGDPEQNPKKWNKVILGDICDAKDRVNYGVVQPGNDFEGGIPLIRVGDIDGGILSFTSIKTIDPKIEKDYSRSRLKGNEILVSCVGSIGTIAKVPNKAIGFNIARAITRVPLQDKRIINFVAECLKTEAIQNYFKKNTRTVSQPTLNVSFVKETEIIFPNEEKILDFCKIVDKVEFQKELLQKALVMQESLFQSLQNQAFSGTL